MIGALNTLAFVYQSVSKINIVLFSALVTVIICTIVIKLLIFKKYDVFSTILLIASLVTLFLNSEKKVLFTILTILFFIIILVVDALACYKYLCIDAVKQKVEEHIKNDTTDFFICMDKKDRIISSSVSFAQMTKLTKKEIDKKKGWKLIFESLNIQKINGEENITSNRDVFLSHLDEVLSKYKMYEFTFAIKDKDTDEIVNYHGYIQAIYLRDKKVGTAVYFYSDKQTIISNIKSKLDVAVNNLYNHKNVLHILMSLSEGVALYYDYQEKLFYATQSFQEFTGIDKQAYTFREFYEMIVEEDIERYNEQSETVNSISPTRIKIRLRINNICFNAIEDSIFLTKEGEEYISIVHITSRCDEGVKDQVLSTKESVDLLSDISETPVAPIVYKVEEILSESLKDDENEE